jgi:hypothetical protein
MAAVICAAGSPSMRVMLPWTRTCWTVATWLERHGSHRADRQLAQLVD